MNALFHPYYHDSNPVISIVLDQAHVCSPIRVAQLLTLLAISASGVPLPAISRGNL